MMMGHAGEVRLPPHENVEQSGQWNADRPERQAQTERDQQQEEQPRHDDRAPRSFPRFIFSVPISSRFSRLLQSIYSHFAFNRRD